MQWNLRYASHLGYRSPEQPLLRAWARGSDVVAHIELAAKLGLSGVQYALAVIRPAGEHARVLAALSAANLQAGCILYAPIEVARTPLWAQAPAGAQKPIERHLRTAIHVARSVNSRHIALLSGADPRLPTPTQRQNFISNLIAAARIAESENMILCLENMAPSSIPDMLLQHIGDAHAIVQEIGSPAIRLIFDTAHVHAMDGDVLTHLQRCLPETAIVQFADSPGRMEPGSGSIDFRAVIETLQANHYRGLVELEHGWTEPTVECETAAIERLNRWDSGR
jgi:hydroxypyruvate isomerase